MSQHDEPVRTASHTAPNDQGHAALNSVRLGFDACRVSDVASSMQTFGDRYRKRVFTSRELAYCTQDLATEAERLAARFAAKEATIKVLRPIDVRPDWRNIEVVRSDAGWCDLKLTGLAADLARDAGITSLALSMSHDADYAHAAVVAVLEPREGKGTRS
jgi:holo-[acyl-carrier protein] synthase